MVSPNNVRAGYDRWATIYDHDANPLLALETPFVRETAGEVTNLTVLDLGCGTGRHATWLAKCGARVTAIDFSPGMLAEAQRKPNAEKVRFLVHDLHNPFPFKNEEFDLVVSALVLEHIQNISQFFSEVSRVLQSTGRAIITTMHPAMFLRGVQAQFHDPASQEVIQPGSIPHQISDFLMAALRANLQIKTIHEAAPDAAFAESFPRAVKYIGWPMLFAMEFAR